MSDVIAEPFPRSNCDLINRIRLIEGDLTKQHDVDALVGSISTALKVNGTLNQSLIAAAGTQIDDFILEHIYKPRAGDVFAVPPFHIPVKHIFFAVTPDWKDGLAQEDRDLIRCYRGAVQLATEMRLTSMAFPALGTGKKRYPVRRAARLGVQGIMDRMSDQIEEVRIVCNRREQYDAFAHWLKFYGYQGPSPSPHRGEGKG